MRTLTKRLLLFVLLFAGILSMGGPCGSPNEIWYDILDSSPRVLRPHWSADGQAIIFRGLPQDALQSLEAWVDGNLYRVRLDGAGLEKIASEAYWLDVSPTGDRISFTTVSKRKSMNTALKVLGKTGSDQRRLTEPYGGPIIATFFL